MILLPSQTPADAWSNLTLDGWSELPLDGCPDVEFAYDYSVSGNRNVRAAADGGRVTSTYDAANRLLSTFDDEGLTTFTYDPNGNQRTIETPLGEITTQTWDAENRLVQVEHHSGEVIDYSYDIDGHRVAQDDGLETQQFVFDGNTLLQTRDDVGALDVEYTYEPAAYGQPLSQRQDGESSFYLANGIHDVIALTDDTGTVTDDYRYDAWGRRIASMGATPNPFTYKGRLGYYHDPNLSAEEATFLLHHRAYDAPNGRFLSADPIEDDPNTYRYVRNNPVNSADPSGLEGPTPYHGSIQLFELALDQNEVPPRRQ